MGFGFKKRPLFSPRAATAPIRLNPIEDETVEIRTGPNSIRYVPRSVAAVTPPVTVKKDGYGLTYKELKKIKREQRRAAVHIDYIDGEPYINDSIGFRREVTTPYSWSPTRWSTWNFNSYLNTNVDDDSNLFVKAPENYITPNVSQISAKTNYRINEDIRTIKELARVCYFKMIDDKEYIAEMYKENDGQNIDSDAWRKKKEMYDNVYNTFVPGFSPLEQAVAILHKVKDMEAANRKAIGHGRSSRSGSFQFRRNDYSDPDLNAQMDMTPFNCTHQLAILNKISIIGDLGNQFKVEKSIGEKEVANSDVTRKKPMRSYDQIQNIDIYQKLLPHYKIKFLTKDLLVNVPVRVSEKKQKIIILIDFSGSMNQTDKQVWVNALLADRFRYVMRGEAEVFVSFFNSYPSGMMFTHVKNAQDVKNFWKHFSNYPSGGYTNVGRIVEYVASEVKRGRLHNLNVDLSQELPEILVINDGQDEVGVDAFPYKVNAVSLMEFSDELKDLCVATGGKQVKITESNEITAYSSNGKEVIA